MSDTLDVIASLEATYAAALAEKAARWQARHPDAAKQIREAVAAKFRPVGSPEPPAGSLQWLTFEAAVVEAIRAQEGWPTEREFVRIQAGQEGPRYFPPAIKKGPVRDLADRKAASAGERE
jgi:hypothetical protein